MWAGARSKVNLISHMKDAVQIAAKMGRFDFVETARTRFGEQYTYPGTLAEAVGCAAGNHIERLLPLLVTARKLSLMETLTSSLLQKASVETVKVLINSDALIGVLSKSDWNDAVSNKDPEVALLIRERGGFKFDERQIGRVFSGDALELFLVMVDEKEAMWETMKVDWFVSAARQGAWYDALCHLLP